MKAIVLTSAMILVSSTQALAGDVSSACSTVKFRGTWIGSCADAPEVEQRLSFPNDGACGDLNYRGEAWTVGEAASHTVSNPMASHSIATTFGSAWSESNQELKFFRSISAQPLQAGNQLEAYALSASLRLSEPTQLIETRMVLDGVKGTQSSKVCEYTLQAP